MYIKTIHTHVQAARLLAALVIGAASLPSVALAATQQGTSVSPPRNQAEAELPLPPRATLVGTASVSEIRAFPEQVQTKGGERAVEEVQGVRAVDRLYQTDAPYAGTVSFYDHAFPSRDFTVQRRTTTSSSTVWSLRRADGSQARLAVRNTSPTTIEWVAARGQERPVQ